MSDSAQTVIERTQCWIDNIVIGLNLCPFAGSAFKNGSIEYHVSGKHENDIEQHLQQLAERFKQLDSTDSIDTSLLIFARHYKNFDDYLDMLYLANQRLDDLNYVGIYQIASFHPSYCFDGVDANDVANFTNRSPYPMLHILREHSVEEAIEHYDDIASVPENNIKRLRKIGLQEMQHRIKTLSGETP